MLPEARAASAWRDSASLRSASVVSKESIKGSGACCGPQLTPLLNFPVGLLSSARLAPEVGSAESDLRDAREEMRLPIEGRLCGSCASSGMSAGGCVRWEAERVKRASTLAPIELDEDRRKGLAWLPKRDVEGGARDGEEEEGTACAVVLALARACARDAASAAADEEADGWESMDEYMEADGANFVEQGLGECASRLWRSRSAELD